MKLYYEYLSGSDFRGYKFTTSDNYGNIPILKSYFIENDFKGRTYKIRYNNSYLVKGKFLKPEIWGKFTKVGQLTEIGIKFIDYMVRNLDYQTFKDYINVN